MKICGEIFETSNIVYRAFKERVAVIVDRVAVISLYPPRMKNRKGDYLCV